MEHFKSQHECFLHKEKHEVSLLSTEVNAYTAWKEKRGFIQDLLPRLSSDEREILMTGTCPESWDTMFSEEECYNDCDGSKHPGLFCK